MEYYINPSVFMAGFAVPISIVDNHLKFAKGDHIKVLLYILRNNQGVPAPEEISEVVDIPVFDVKEALLYWADANILIPQNQTAQNKEGKKVIKKDLKPSRSDITRRALEDNKIKHLLLQAQMKLGRNLKQNETETLVWLYDDEGMDISLILFIIQYAISKNKPNIRFIETTAINWLEEGIETIAEADEKIKKEAESEQSWFAVCKAFGLEKRKPSKKELENSYKWVVEWGLSKEMLTAAYEACVDAKSSFSFPYVSKIIETWHQKGYKTPADIETNKPAKKEKDYAAYDLDLFEKMLNSKD